MVPKSSGEGAEAVEEARGAGAEGHKAGRHGLDGSRWNGESGGPRRNGRHARRSDAQRRLAASESGASASQSGRSRTSGLVPPRSSARASPRGPRLVTVRGAGEQQRRGELLLVEPGLTGSPLSRRSDRLSRPGESPARNPRGRRPSWLAPHSHGGRLRGRSIPVSPPGTTKEEESPCDYEYQECHSSNGSDLFCISFFIGGPIKHEKFRATPETIVRRPLCTIMCALCREKRIRRAWRGGSEEEASLRRLLIFFFFLYFNSSLAISKPSAYEDFFHTHHSLIRRYIVFRAVRVNTGR